MVMGMADCNKCIHLPVCCRLTCCLVNGKVVCDHYLESEQATSDENKRWIPVTERLPERGQEVIVASYRMIKPVVFTTIFWNKEHDNWYGITHWMPLPEPPKEDV